MREWMSTRMEAGTTMTSLARTERPGHDTANLSPSVAARHACRSGMVTTTAGVANGFVLGNLVILPEKLAASVASARMPEERPPLYGDGHAAERVAASLADRG